MNAHQENRIIARVQAGRIHEFEHLVRHYQGALFRVVGNLVHHPHQLEDLVQDIFLAAFSQIHRFDPDRGTFQAWLFTIARNRASNARKKKRELLLAEAPVIPDHRTAVDAMLTKEAFGQLDQALDQLKFQDRVIYVLAEVEGIAYAEIARIENLRLGTVKSRLARIRAKLRNALKHYAN
jgi:RNA polymerase sigma factor (sigma-70 family)